MERAPSPSRMRFLQSAEYRSRLGRDDGRDADDRPARPALARISIVSNRFLTVGRSGSTASSGFSSKNGMLNQTCAQASFAQRARTSQSRERAPTW